MKTAEEVQRCHDLLHPIVTRELALDITDQARNDMATALGMLCWLLGHEGGNAVDAWCKSIEKEIARQGFRLRRGPDQVPATDRPVAQPEAEPSPEPSTNGPTPPAPRDPSSLIF